MCNVISREHEERFEIFDSMGAAIVHIRTLYIVKIYYFISTLHRAVDYLSAAYHQQAPSTLLHSCISLR